MKKIVWFWSPTSTFHKPPKTKFYSTSTHFVRMATESFVFTYTCQDDSCPRCDETATGERFHHDRKGRVCCNICDTVAKRGTQIAPPPPTVVPTPKYSPKESAPERGYVLLSGRLVTPVLCSSRLQLQEHLENALESLEPGISAEITLQTLVPDTPQTTPARKFVFTFCEPGSNYASSSPSFDIEEVGTGGTMMYRFVSQFVNEELDEFLPFDD